MNQQTALISHQTELKWNNRESWQKTSHHGKKHSINPERLAKIAQESPVLTV